MAEMSCHAHVSPVPSKKLGSNISHYKQSEGHHTDGIRKPIRARFPGIYVTANHPFFKGITVLNEKMAI